MHRTRPEPTPAAPMVAAPSDPAGPFVAAPSFPAGPFAGAPAGRSITFERRLAAAWPELIEAFDAHDLHHGK